MNKYLLSLLMASALVQGSDVIHTDLSCPQTLAEFIQSKDVTQIRAGREPISSHVLATYSYNEREASDYTECDFSVSKAVKPIIDSYFMNVAEDESDLESCFEKRIEFGSHWYSVKHEYWSMPRPPGTLIEVFNIIPEK